MSLACASCGYSNDDGVEWCQNPAPLENGRRCDHCLRLQPGFAAAGPRTVGPAPPPPPTPRTVQPLRRLLSVSLSASSLEVAAGESVSCEVLVDNGGDIVDEFGLELLGAPSSWATLEPAVLPLLPGTGGVARIRLHPPRSSVVNAGRVPFTIQVTSRANPHHSATATGTVAVAAFVELGVDLRPVDSSGRLSGSHRLIVTNRGNSRVEFRVSAEDHAEHLSFDFTPPRSVAHPGGDATTEIRVRPRRWLWWRQPPQLRPFEVRVAPVGSQPPLTTSGSLLQRSLIPIRVRALAATLVLLTLLPFTPRLAESLIELAALPPDIVTPAMAPARPVPCPGAPAARTCPTPPKRHLSLGSIVPGGGVTQGFGCTDLAIEPIAPDCPGGHFHTGIDLAAPAGTAVFAAARGRAGVIFDQGGYGTHVVLQHDATTLTLYGHLEGSTVKAGDLVEQGQQLGWVGSTGLSTGPHLHFEVRRKGQPIEPEAWLRN